MSDSRPPSAPEPPLELARPSRTTPAPAPAAPASRPAGVRSAARASATPAAPRRTRITGAQVQERAADTVLNAFSILGEVIEDFRRADRYFKFKALVLLCWLAAVVAAFWVAFPDLGPRNPIRAHLVISGDAASPVYMVENLSNGPWQDVEILVDGRFRATQTQLEPNLGVTLSPAVLFDADGVRAPSNLKITDIEVRVTDPEGSVVLLQGGVPQQQR